MKSVSEIIAEELKKNKINDIFMLTGYGAMYLNDAIEKKNIRYFSYNCKWKVFKQCTLS